MASEYDCGPGQKDLQAAYKKIAELETELYTLKQNEATLREQIRELARTDWVYGYSGYECRQCGAAHEVAADILHEDDCLYAKLKAEGANDGD